MSNVKEIAHYLRETGTGCNCDLDNWQPERITGHSWVCRIHKMAINASPELQKKASEWSAELAVQK